MLKHAHNGIFQSTPPVRGATSIVVVVIAVSTISIHAPRAGSDCIGLDQSYTDTDFNPRPPCGERLKPGRLLSFHCIFQSTPPVRGATRAVLCPCAAQGAFQSTPPVRGATGISWAYHTQSRKFQSTPPVRGATPTTRRQTARPPFQSTPPVRGATVKTRIIIRIFK